MTDAPSSPRLRICFPFVDGLLGGSHISALTMMRGLDAERFAPEVLLAGEQGNLTKYLDGEAIPYRRIELPAPMSGNPAALFQNVRAAARILREGGYDYVHTNEGAVHVTWGLASRLAGVRQVWHHRQHPEAKGLRFIAPMTARKVVSVSRFAAPRAGFLSARERCSVIHSPFDTSSASIDREESRRSALAELDLDGDPFLVGFFAQFGKRKRPEAFVRAIAAAVEREGSRPIHGLLFGEEYEPGFEALVRSTISELGVGDRVRLMGFRKPAEPWLAACDALLVPAVDEPFGRTLIEAMLVGTPVVAAASGGNIEAIEDRRTGLLAPADDTDAMAQLLIELANDKDLASKIARTAKAEALEKFGIDKHVRAIEELYLGRAA